MLANGRSNCSNHTSSNHLRPTEPTGNPQRNPLSRILARPVELDIQRSISDDRRFGAVRRRACFELLDQRGYGGPQVVAVVVGDVGGDCLAGGCSPPRRRRGVVAGLALSRLTSREWLTRPEGLAVPTPGAWHSNRLRCSDPASDGTQSLDATSEGNDNPSDDTREDDR
jgi:hypothetical protein